MAFVIKDDKVPGLAAQAAATEKRVNEIFVNVRDFKCDDNQYVQGDGVHDDSTGIRKAVDFALSKVQLIGTWSSATLTIFFPAGRYKITQKGVLNTFANVALKGVNIRGAGFQNTWLLYTYAGAEEDSYLMQVGGSAGKWAAFCNIEYLSIQGNGSNKFFGLYTQDGAPTSFRFNNVSFEKLSEFVSIRYGTANANGDMFKFFQCKGVMPENSTIFAIWNATNSQSVAHDFVQCDFDTEGYIWYIKSGGSINAYGGSWTGTPKSHLFHIEGLGTAIGRGNNNFTVNGVRIEIRRGTDPGVINNGSLFYLNAVAKLQFKDMSFGQLTSNSAGQDADVQYGIIDTYGEVSFENCLIAKTFKKKMVINSNSYAASYRPTIKYANCTMEEEAGKLVSIDQTNNVNNGASNGKIVVENSVGYRTNGTDTQMPVDVSINTHYGYSDSSDRVKTFTFSQSPNMLSAGIKVPVTGGTTSTSTFKLPIGARVKKVYFVYYKAPVFGAYTNQFTVSLLGGDGVTNKLLASTVLNMANGVVGDYVLFPTSEFMYLITDATKQTMTLEATGSQVGAGAIPGYVMVEYI